MGPEKVRESSERSRAYNGASIEDCREVKPHSRDPCYGGADGLYDSHVPSYS